NRVQREEPRAVRAEHGRNIIPLEGADLPAVGHVPNRTAVTQPIPVRTESNTAPTCPARKRTQHLARAQIEQPNRSVVAHDRQGGPVGAEGHRLPHEGTLFLPRLHVPNLDLVCVFPGLGVEDRHRRREKPVARGEGQLADLAVEPGDGSDHLSTSQIPQPDPPWVPPTYPFPERSRYAGAVRTEGKSGHPGWAVIEVGYKTACFGVSDVDLPVFRTKPPAFGKQG